MIKKWGTYHTKFLKHEYLFRYTKKEHIIDMFQYQSLYLTQMDRFDDKLEGISTFDIPELLSSYKDFFQDDIKDDSYSPYYLNLIKEDAKNRLNNVRKRLLDGQRLHFVSCWFNSNRESDGMWRFYGKENGFAIKVSLKALEKSIQESVDINAVANNQFVRVGKIKYQDFPNVMNNEPSNSVLYLAFRKDDAFSHENEYRIVFMDRTDYPQNYKFYKIKNFSKLDITIICHPGMEHLEFLEAKIEFEKFGSNIHVKKSELEPFYQLFSRTKEI